MAIWYLNRPENEADATEIAVAQKLRAQLDDEWTIRWGYYYGKRGKNHTKDKEGDLLIQGPCGRVLVMEIKGGSLRHFAGTGSWQNRSHRDNDNPITQLLNEWNAIVTQLNTAGKKDKSVPFIGKALCCTNVDEDTKKTLIKQNDRKMLIFEDDLDRFTEWWDTHLGSQKSFADAAAAKALFKKVLLAGGSQSVQRFLSQSDQIFEDFQQTEFEVLEMLQRNHQWMIEGGVGTGKNLMALKQAEIVAQQGEGRDVLFLVYHLPLAERMKALVAKLDLERGSIAVRSWEELVYEMIKLHQSPPSPPPAEDKQATATFYGETLPALVDAAFAAGAVPASYDALVVPEAQDNPTGSTQSSEKLRWWSWYFKLLKAGTAAPIYLFYDPRLRSDFSDGALFEPADIRQALPQAVQVELTAKRSLHLADFWFFRASV